MTMLIDVSCALATVVILCCSMALRPKHARCPDGWLVNGIRPSGRFDCLRVPGGDPMYDGAGGMPDRSYGKPGVVGGRLYCTGGSHPIVVDYQTVGCQR